jgi:hypothetical protein
MNALFSVTDPISMPAVHVSGCPFFRADHFHKGVDPRLNLSLGKIPFIAHIGFHQRPL